MLLVAPEGSLEVATFVSRSPQQLLFVARRPQESPSASYCNYVFVVKSFCRFLKPVDVRSFQRFYGITARFTVTWGCSLPLPNSCAHGLRPAYPSLCNCRAISVSPQYHLAIFFFFQTLFLWGPSVSQPISHTYSQTAAAMAGSRPLSLLIVFCTSSCHWKPLVGRVSAWKLLAMVATIFYLKPRGTSGDHRKFLVCVSQQSRDVIFFNTRSSQQLGPVANQPAENCRVFLKEYNDRDRERAAREDLGGASRVDPTSGFLEVLLFFYHTWVLKGLWGQISI